MFRLTPSALTSQRKRRLEPGSLSVKVGGKHFYPRKLIDSYLAEPASEAQQDLGLDDTETAEMFQETTDNRSTDS